ncbi:MULTISPECIES: MFS transporter [unclassified Streptomyces]|uniref:MFS transporter n=1 Tax=unclassified Streptomyces TaxID=2593676 RepID=UPI000DAD6F74|nr:MULTISPECIES: MFS transporter [unclassified Streptomyces]PZT76129.1 MFS transporter [Streptomyces sp. AC1-42W]PZT79919.1 MFS transporter [Streptomyces sp. AC1-42T]
MTPLPSRPAGAVHRYYALRAVGWMTDQLIQFLLPVLAYQATGELSWSGLVLAAQWVPRLLSLPVAGHLADRYPEQRIYRANDLVRVGLGVVAAVLTVVLESHAFAVVIVFALLAGICCEQVLVAGEKLAGTLVAPEDMHRAQSVLSGIEQGTLLLAPVVGGALLLTGPLPIVVVVASLFGVSLLLSLGLPRAERTAAAGPVPVPVLAPDPVPGEGKGGGRGSAARRLLGDSVTGIRNVVRIPVLRTIVLATMCVNIMLGLIQGVAPALADRYGHNEGALGLVYSAAGLVAMVTLTAAPRLIRSFGFLAVAAVSTVVQGVVFIALGPTTGFLFFAALVAVFMAGDSVFSVVIRTLRLRVVVSEEFGRTVAAVSLLNFLSLPLAGGLLAVTGHAVPLVVLIPVVGAAAMACLAVLMVRLKRYMAAEPALYATERPAVEADGPDRAAHPAM